jgi:ornithine carbamoyltransferase
MTRHFLDLTDCGPEGVELIVRSAAQGPSQILRDQSVAMVFEKPSVRTRNSTEMAVVHLGGHPVMIVDAEVGIDTRESAEDVARTLGCFHQSIAARVRDHSAFSRMAQALAKQGSTVNLINLLSDHSHPCQAIADVLTLADEFGGVDGLVGKHVVYVGDANNVARSLAQASLALGASITICAPDDYQFDDATAATLASFARHGATLARSDNPQSSAKNCDALYTDVWTSMGQEQEAQVRREALAQYSITEELVSLAQARAIVLHCLPAHRGEEITNGVLEGSHSRVWQQAKHRETAMYGIFAWLKEAI